jgi:hypothetical protein
MSDISELKAQKYIETENKRNESEIKKMRAESEREYASPAQKSEIEIKRLKIMQNKNSLKKKVSSKHKGNGVINGSKQSC